MKSNSKPIQNQNNQSSNAERSSVMSAIAQKGADIQNSFSWANTLFLILSPIVAVVGTTLYTIFSGFSWADLILFVVLYSLTGLSITAGYHRYYSHRSYQSNRLVQLFYLLFGASAFQNSVLHWASDHRIHHQHVDTDSDPYNIKKGFFWAHMGWIFYKSPSDRTFDNVPYLLNDKRVMFQHRYYIWIATIMGFVVPMLIASLWGHPMAGFFWGGWLKIVAIHHSTFLINSACHWFGSQPHTPETSARNCWWLAFATFGEGYHNFHHTFASDYRNGFKWYHWDPTKWVIYGFSKIGFTKKLNRSASKYMQKKEIPPTSLLEN